MTATNIRTVENYHKNYLTGKPMLLFCLQQKHIKIYADLRKYTKKEKQHFKQFCIHDLHMILDTMLVILQHMKKDASMPYASEVQNMLSIS